MRMLVFIACPPRCHSFPQIARRLRPLADRVLVKRAPQQLKVRFLCHCLSRGPKRVALCRLCCCCRGFRPTHPTAAYSTHHAPTLPHQTAGGVLLPETAVQRINEATVVAVGPGSLNREGNLVPVALSVGDKVLLPEYGGHTVSLSDNDDDEVVLFRADDILGVFEVRWVGCPWAVAVCAVLWLARSQGFGPLPCACVLRACVFVCVVLVLLVLFYRSSQE